MWVSKGVVIGVVFLFSFVGRAESTPPQMGDSDKVVSLVRSFFDEDTAAPKRAVKNLEADAKFSKVVKLTALHFEPKDIWGNRDYVFGYGTLADGSAILFAWKNSNDAPTISLKDLSGIYEDERMASIQDEKDLKRWKKMREIVAGSFIGVRRSDLKVNSLYPVTEESAKLGAKDLVVGVDPLVVCFTGSAADAKTKNLVGMAEALPTR